MNLDGKCVEYCAKAAIVFEEVNAFFCDSGTSNYGATVGINLLGCSDKAVSVEIPNINDVFPVGLLVAEVVNKFRVGICQFLQQLFLKCPIEQHDRSFIGGVKKMEKERPNV